MYKSLPYATFRSVKRSNPKTREAMSKKDSGGESPPPAEILLGRYEIGRLLGRGTFARVHIARSLSSDSLVAVKILSKADLIPPSRILDEISAMRLLSDHPHIIRLHEVLATRSKICFVMEYARGGELLSRLARRGRFPEATASRYFHQLLSALRFCHAHGVAHRDLKPQNLLLDSDGNLKVSDFGLSALPDRRRDCGMLSTACGTPAYAAPEIARRKPYDGQIADAWSCGVILYVLLAGYLPFDDSNLPEMYRRMHRRDYRFPPWFSPAAKRLISRLMDPDPGTRMRVDSVTELSWFRRANSTGESIADLVPPMAVEPPASARPLLNAFDIITLSAGLDLSGMFEEGGRRFAARAQAEAVVGRIEEAGSRLGFVFERWKEGGGAKGKGRAGAVMTVELGEVAPAMLIGVVRVEGGIWKEEDRLCWEEELRAELKDLVFAWY